MNHRADYWRRNVWLDWVALGVALATFVNLALINISHWSIWFDEAFGLYLSRFSVWDIAYYTAADVHPPLYYIVLKGWEALVGTSELGVRSLSVIFAAAAIGFGFMIVRRLFGRCAALMSLPIMILAPMTLRYAQEARMYTMAMAICAAATYILIILHLHPPQREQTKKRLWLIYALLIAIGLWTHYFTSLIWIVHWVWRWWMRREKGKGVQLKSVLTPEWVRAYIIAGILFLPWLPFLARQFVGLQASGFWIGPVTVEHVTGIFSNALVYQDTWRLKQWPAALFMGVGLLLAVLGTRLYRQLPTDKRPGYVLLCMYWLLPILILVVFSLPPLRPIVVERYFTHTLLGFYMLIGVIIALYKWPRHAILWRSLTFGLVLLTLGFGVSNVYVLGNFNNSNLTQPTAKETMQLIARHSSGHEPVIADGSYIFYETVYYQTPEHQAYIIDTPQNFSNNATLMIRDHEPNKIKNLSTFAREHPRVWVMSNRREDPAKPPVSGWRVLDSFWTNDHHDYHATLFATS